MSGKDSNGACWYLIQCKPKQDLRAEQNLRNQSFSCYRPVHQVEKIRSGRRVRVEESLFPGYLFIRLDCMHDNWYAIRSTRGVARLVTFGQEPARIAPLIINTIKNHADSKPLKASLCCGDRVRITEGPFVELEALFMRTDGDERVVLLLNMLHREQQLTLPLRAVKPIRSVREPSKCKIAGPKYA